MADFFSRLSYSFGNEDWVTEQKALQIKPKDKILCITASGDRPLHLLPSGASEVVSIDANRYQTALGALKQSALQTLSFDDYLAFLGEKPCATRRALFEVVKEGMDPEMVTFWDKRLSMVGKGVLYQGAIEKWLSRISHVLKIIRKDKIDRLFSFDDIEKQREFVNHEWNSRRWEKGFQLILHPALTRFFIKDPGLYEHVSPSYHVGNYIYNKLNGHLENYLAKQSPLAALVFLGKITEEAKPPYLTKEGTTNIRPHLSNLKHQTTDLLSYLQSAQDNSIDAFSLSDVASYISRPDFEKVCIEMKRVARKKARFCIRQFLSDHSIPRSVQEHFQREPELEKELEAQDRCFVYRFMVGSIGG